MLYGIFQSREEMFDSDKSCLSIFPVFILFLFTFVKSLTSTQHRQKNDSSFVCKSTLFLRSFKGTCAHTHTHVSEKEKDLKNVIN